jgi:hypothetical protein
MELSEAIKKAQQAVTDADLPEGLRAIAFQEVLRYCLSGAYLNTASPGPTHGVAASPAETQDRMARLAAKTGVSGSALADLFDVDGEVTLHVASSRIDSTKSKATREVALLVTAARQGSGIDDSWTPTSRIRDALQQYNRYDPNNFSSYLRKAGDFFNFKGKGSTQETRLTKPGWEAATELIRSLAN